MPSQVVITFGEPPVAESEWVVRRTAHKAKEEALPNERKRCMLSRNMLLARRPTGPVHTFSFTLRQPRNQVQAINYSARNYPTAWSRRGHTWSASVCLYETGGLRGLLLAGSSQPLAVQ